MTGRPRRAAWTCAVAIGLAATVALAGCADGSSDGQILPEGTSSAVSEGPLTLWAHKGNAPAEAEPLKAAVASFNISHPTTPVTIKFIAENDYPTTISAASASTLPDILEVNGPTVGSEVRVKHITPLDNLLDSRTISNLTGPIKDQGTSNGKLYAVGQFDSAVGIYANKKMLDDADVKYPTSLQTDWTAEEFTAAVKTLAAKNTTLPGKSLDLKLNYKLTSEFGTYAYSPLVWSAGGDLMKDGKAAGAMDSDASVRVLRTVASWKPYVTPNTDDRDFVSGKVALSYVGHWAYPKYSKALGKDLLALPLPNFGKGPKSGAGSWAWGITPNSKHPKAAAAFLDFLMDDNNVNAMVAINGAPPGTKSTLAESKQYGRGGTLQLWGDLAMAASGTQCVSGLLLADNCGSIVRPVTAGYPTVTREFANTLDAVFNGADAKATLSKAAATVDTDFADNDGYK